MADSTQEIVPGIYQHFKGQRYRVLGVGKHSETQERFVVYQALYGEGELWVRPVAMFTEETVIDKEKGTRGPRFTLVEQLAKDAKPSDAH